MQNPIQIKLMRQIDNLEHAKSKIDVMIRCLTQDLGYQSINRFTYDARKHHLEQAQSNINESIHFLLDFYQKAKGIDVNEFIGTKEVAKAN